MTDSLVQRLEVAVARLETLTAQRPSIAPKPNLTSLPAQALLEKSSIEVYDEIIEEPLKKFVALCPEFGSNVVDAANKLQLAFELHRNFIWLASGQLEPTDQEVIKAKLQPITELIISVVKFADSKRNLPVYNHLSSISGAIQGLGWLTVKPMPEPYVKEFNDVAMFYINRVRTFHKYTIHSEWSNALCDLMNALQKYVRQVHTTGLVWNSSPGAAPIESTDSFAKGSLKAVSKSGGPPPPPPPPPGLLNDFKLTSESSNTDIQKLFADLNKGEAVTAGLRKVTNDMQTHKNPNLRLQSTTKASNKAVNSVAKKAPTAAPERSPKTELKDYKVWNVEYHKQNNNIVIEAEMKQAVYIYRCENSVIKIKGKVNSVTVDSCKKTSVVFDNLLAQVEVINSQSIEVQSLGALPTISIQKTDGCQVYLSKDSLNAEIVTSKSSEMNILVPSGSDGEFVEYAVPEQFKTTVSIEKKRLETTVSDIV